MAVFDFNQDNINTDLMFPGKYTYESSNLEFIKEHLFEDLDSEFSKKAKKGDIIIVGKNFGCGSSREQPAVGLKYIGIRAIIAKSFARIFYRSATNQGLLLIECQDAVEYYKNGNNIDIDEKNGRLKIGDREFSFPPLPAQMQEIIQNGGLLKNIKKRFYQR
ncbi:MAG: 3-isopropylmalate dehydratase [Candidatus Cloacimonetes bacterium]|nr:3-isopropylmalate dehydratase [Candidatus Cloacimonadota bacterium]MBL7107730.1 3-isopropylmalate dehydratase [Candidatus Cloacimonadota bacterium]